MEKRDKKYRAFLIFLRKNFDNSRFALVAKQLLPLTNEAVIV